MMGQQIETLLLYAPLCKLQSNKENLTETAKQTQQQEIRRQKPGIPHITK